MLNGAVGLLLCVVTTRFACVSVGRAIHLDTHRMNLYRSVVVGQYNIHVCHCERKWHYLYINMVLLLAN